MPTLALEKPKPTDVAPTLSACADRIRTANDRLKVEFTNWLEVVSGELRTAQSLLPKCERGFEDWCRNVFGWSPQHVRRLIQANLTLEAITEPTGSVKPKTKPKKLPTNERQLRELSKVPKDEVAEVWQEVVAKVEASAEPITAKVVREVVQERVAVKPKPEPKLLDIDSLTAIDRFDIRIMPFLKAELNLWPESLHPLFSSLVSQFLEQHVDP